MARTQVGTQQILDGGIGRADLNTTTAGSAVIAKVTPGTGITIASTGADAGTGDVTVGLADSGVIIGSYPKVTVDAQGRVTSGSALDAGDIVAGSNNYVQNQSAEAQIGNAWLSGWLAGSSFRTYNGTNYAELRAPNTLATNVSFALPNAYSAAGYTLTDDGSGNLSWAAITGNVLTGLVAGSNTAIADTDSILTAFAKLQAQITAGGGGGGSSAVKHSARFTLGEAVTNTSAYFYVSRSLGASQDDKQRSGSGSGMSYANSCSPWEVQKAGIITSATLHVYGLGVNNGTATLPANYVVNLYRVGTSTAQDTTVNGGLPNTLSFPIASGSIGIYSVSVGSWIVQLTTSIAVSAGDMLALQFVNGSGASGIAMSQHAYISLEITES